MPSWYEPILERDLVPDSLIRIGIRNFTAGRLRQEAGQNLAQLVERLKKSPLAVHTADANAQHYEVPEQFFGLVLGKHRKYSCCYWPAGVSTLDEAEERMLVLTCERAQLANGQRILELGCGWGSLSLYMAARYPDARITAISNSNSQREYITAQARSRGLANLEVLTQDMVEFQTDGRFDRVVSVEMFEHMRNYQELFRRVASWLKPGGLVFVHIFSHKKYAYLFEHEGATDWMAEHFFTGGIMPGDDLFSHFADDLRIREHWRFDGTHYEKTARAWLERMDANRDAILKLFRSTYGAGEELKWLVRWRVFFMACEEVWAFRGGSEWLVSHYLFEPVSKA